METTTQGNKKASNAKNVSFNRDGRQIINLVSKEIRKFLLDHGGLNNGCDTWAKGTISQNVTGSLSLFTPKCKDLTYNEVSKLSGKLEKQVKDLLLSCGVKEFDIIVERNHKEYGCYNTLCYVRTESEII